MSDEPALLVDAICLGRRHPQQSGWLFQDVSLSVAAGDRLALTGPTGSGKTLLLRALAMLDPLDQGQIIWQGKQVSGTCLPAYRADVMYVHQSAVLFPGSVEDNLRQPFTLRQHRDKTFPREEIQRNLDALGRSGLLTQPAQSLSGGERQIVALLRAMQLNPSVLLLDEPTASLDVAATQSIERLVDVWQREVRERRAYVWVSHTTDQVLRVADRVLKIEQGTLKDASHAKDSPSEGPRNA